MVAAPQCADAFTIEGPGRAVDSHTVIVRGTHVLLLGVTPIEASSSCGPAASPWPCGTRAQEALTLLLGAAPVTCDLTTKVGHGDFQGSCATADQTDLGRALVEAGWARASDDRYAPAEAAARSAQRGAWGARPPE
jgi:endonuclease YncB( thermonuclease family)